MPQLFPNGIQGLSDSKWAGRSGSAYRLVGIDYRTTPGLVTAHQKLTKDSSTTVTELCKVQLAVSDGSTLHFSSESGKIWREVSGTYTLVHTTVPTSGDAGCSGAEEYAGDILWFTEDYVHKIAVAGIGDTWSDVVQQNWGAFKNGIREHPSVQQNLAVFVGDGQDIAEIRTPTIDPDSPLSTSVSFGSSVLAFGVNWLVHSSTPYVFPEYVKADRHSAASTSSLTKSFTVDPGYDRLMVVLVAAWSTTGSFPASVSGVTFDGDALTSRGGGTGAINGSNDYGYSMYTFSSPDVKTGDVVATFDSSVSHGVVHIYQFNKGKQSGDIVSDREAGFIEPASTSLTVTAEDEATYATRMFFAMSQTSTHVHVNTEVLDETNSFGRDSASVHTTGTATLQTSTGFSLVAPEYINSLEPFEIDILVGTKADNGLNKSRVIRWDTISTSYVAEDQIDEDGVNAFIRDDNFVYVQAGSYGRFYFYNGEKLEPYFRLPGDWSPTKKAIVHRNAHAFHLGVPVFGLTNSTGNPALQGVYSFGRYSSDYNPSLSLDYPLSTGDFEGVEIGSILTRGADMWVAWKVGSSFGVDKLDWSNKYNGAYIETTQLTSGESRKNLKTFKEAWVDYASLPANTSLAIAYEKKHEGFTALTVVDNTINNQLTAKENVPEVAALRLKYTLTTNANNAPQLESFGFNAGLRGEK